MQKQKYVLDRKIKSEELSFLSCGYEECNPAQVCGPMSRDYYIIHFILDGLGHYYVHNKHFTVKKNQCFLIEPQTNTLYQADPITPWTYTWVCFNGSLAQTLLKQINFNLAKPVITLSSVNTFAKIISDILEHHEFTPANECYIQSALYLIFSNLLTQLQITYDDVEENENYYIEKAIAHINQDFCSLSVEQIAKSLNISQSYLYKLFKNKLNTSPQSFILHTRISKAQELLIKTTIPISQVADNCGYKNAFAFSRAFRQSLGISPKDYRKQYHRGVHDI